MSEAKTLIQKLASIRRELHNIEKRGRNEHFGYDYVQAADVAGTLGTKLAEQDVALCKTEQKVTTGSTQKTDSRGQVKQENWALVECLYVFRDENTSLSFWSTGYGVDTGDKAIYKALTGCFKYFLVQAFCLAMGDDPEADTETDNRRAAPPQNDAFGNLAEQLYKPAHLTQQQAGPTVKQETPLQKAEAATVDAVKQIFPDAKQVAIINSEQLDNLYGKALELAKKAPDRARQIFDRSGVSMEKVVGGDSIEDDAFIKELGLTSIEQYEKRIAWLTAELAK